MNRSIKGPESVAGRMYRMALMALIAGDLPAVDRERCIKIAIVHDIAEAIVGDITPSDGIPKAEKSRREQKALNEMCGVLGGEPIADEIKELWEEYENSSSIDENLVKDFDKVEMILQALEYEKGKFQTEIGKSWAAEVNARRNKRCGKQQECSTFDWLVQPLLKHVSSRGGVPRCRLKHLEGKFNTNLTDCRSNLALVGNNGKGIVKNSGSKFV